MDKKILRFGLTVIVLVWGLSVLPAIGGGLPSSADLRKALQQVVKENNGGFGFHMWGTVVDRDGVVRAMVYSGEDRGAQWPGSRLISAQKANTANAFSLPKLALSTANLYTAVQPGGKPVRSAAQQPRGHDGGL